MAWNNGTYLGNQPGGYYGGAYGYSQPYAQSAAPQMPQTAPQPQSSGLTWVQGEAGAKSWPVAPGQSVMLMDSESTRFYIKTADASGMPLPLRVFDYQEITQGASVTVPMAAQEPQSHRGEYVSREEFEAFRAQILGSARVVKEENANA